MKNERARNDAENKRAEYKQGAKMLMRWTTAAMSGPVHTSHFSNKTA